FSCTTPAPPDIYPLSLHDALPILQNAIKRGAGQLDGVTYDEARYEGYGPGGAAIMVDCLTDNRTRTVAEVRHAFTKNGGNLGSEDRKSTRLNSSHVSISYAVFCLK